MPASRILGTGCYIPPRVVPNFDVMQMMETTDEFIVERPASAAGMPTRARARRT